ncbi:anti-sigma factor family protein [Undibacterium arcticum]
MDCKQAGAVLAAHADRELPLDQTIALERHLEWCEACRRQYASLRTLGGGPQAVRNLSPGAARSAKPHRDRASAIADPTRCGTASDPIDLARSLVHLWIGAGGNVRNRAQRRPVPVSTDGGRSAGRASAFQPRSGPDVEPADGCRVFRPAYGQALAQRETRFFSPAVVDLAAQGFPLQGGRLDYLDGRPVAALVYGRNQHRISVYVWPKPEHWPNVAYRKAAQQWSRQGYHLIHWENGNMSYWAISDAGMRDLENFAQLLRTHDEVAAKS